MQKDSMAVKSFHLLSILLLLTIVGAAIVPSVEAARPGASKSSAQPLNGRELDGYQTSDYVGAGSGGTQGIPNPFNPPKP